MKKSKQDPKIKAVHALEAKISKDKAKLAKLRAAIKPEEVTDYTFKDEAGKMIKLSQLFGSKSELIVIHNMGTSCPYCTLWADGFNGLVPHLENRAAFVVETPNSSAVISKFKKSRQWKFKMISSENTSFRLDMDYADQNGDHFPGASTFIRKGKKIYRYADAAFGPGDNYCVQWDLLDLLPGQSLDWEAKLKY